MKRELSAEKRELLKQRLLGRSRTAEAPTGAPGAVPRRPGVGGAPLAPVQHNLWVADRLLSDNSTFSVHRVLRLTGPLDRDAVRRALDALVARHETLRMVFRDDSPPRQVPLPPGPAPLRTVDLSHLPPAARRAAAVRVAEEEIAQPFDLARGPVFRAVLAVLGDTRHVLVLNLHHCVADEWSCGVLAREFGALYTAATRGTDPATALPPLPASYTDYAAWQSDRLSGDLLAGQLAYWRAALEGVPAVLELPTDHVRPPTPAFWGHGARRLLAPEVGSALRDFARHHNVTLFTALLAVFAGYLHRWSGGQTRFSVLTPVSGRVVADTEPLVGMLANTLPLPVDVGDDPGFGTLVRRMNTVVLGALEHQDVTFEQLVADSGRPRDASRNPLAQVMYQCIEAREHVWELPGVTVEREPIGMASAKVDLSLVAANLEEGVRLDLVGESTLFTPETVERMLDSLVEVVTRAVADPGTTVGEVELLSPGSGHVSSTTPAAPPPSRPARPCSACSPPPSPPRPTPPRSSRAPPGSPTGSSTSARSGSPSGSAPRCRGRARWSASISRAPNGWWRRSSGCGRPGARSCRCRSTIPRTGCGRCWRTRTSRSSSRSPAGTCRAAGCRCCAPRPVTGTRTPDRPGRVPLRCPWISRI